MKIAYISAGLGDSEKNIQHRHVKQDIPIEFYYFSNDNFRPRSSSMSPILQAKIPKMMGWDLVPSFDIYIWGDSIINFADSKAASWTVSSLGDADIAFFIHPERGSVKEEGKFILKVCYDNIKSSKDYLAKRYRNEPIAKQISYYLSDKDFCDDKLYCGGFFVYRNNNRVKNFLKDWLLHNVRWSIQDQISLPYVLSKSDCKLSILPGVIWDNPYTSYNWRPEDNTHKWNGFYREVPTTPSAWRFADSQSYSIGAEYLKDCETVEDWGVGSGGFKRYRPDAIGVDGSSTPHADVITDLVKYKSSVDGIFMRHVLEHNLGWRDILENAIESAKKRLVVVLFTDFNDGNTKIDEPNSIENRMHGIDVYTLNLGKREFYNILSHYSIKTTTLEIPSKTRYGKEIIIVIDKQPSAES